MSTASTLQATLHELIPISRAMGIEVSRLDREELELRAPLALNHNHAGSGFAGSVYAIASLAGWAMLRQLVEREALEAELVLGEATIRYQRPLRRELRALVRLSEAEQARVVGLLRRGEKVRLELEIPLGDPADPDARFVGSYFARPRAG